MEWSTLFYNIRVIFSFEEPAVEFSLPSQSRSLLMRLLDAQIMMYSKELDHGGSIVDLDSETETPAGAPLTGIIFHAETSSYLVSLRQFDVLGNPLKKRINVEYLCRIRKGEELVSELPMIQTADGLASASVTKTKPDRYTVLVYGGGVKVGSDITWVVVPGAATNIDVDGSETVEAGQVVEHRVMIFCVVYYV